MSDSPTIKKKRVRSPSYPSLPLNIALEKAKKLYSSESRNEVIVSVALQHWGYSQKSGDGLKAVAALSNYGLIETSGTSANRRIRLSELALRILLDTRDDSEGRNKDIIVAALRPKIHKKLWNRWGKDLPSHGNMRHTLIFDDKFNENFVDDFLKIYTQTIEFSGLAESEHTLDEETFSDEEFEQSDEANINIALESYETKSKHNNNSELYSPKKKNTNLAYLAPEEFEIAKYPVGVNATIKLIGHGEITKKSIEALLAQLNLAVELGAFNGLEEN